MSTPPSLRRTTTPLGSASAATIGECVDTNVCRERAWISVNQSPLKGRRNVKFRLLKRHPEAFAGFCPHSTELQQQKQMLQRKKATPMSSSGQGEICPLVRVVRRRPI